MGEKYVNAANMLALTLPGTATTYYGEEIGMEDTRIGSGDKKDKISDKYRTVSFCAFALVVLRKVRTCSSPLRAGDDAVLCGVSIESNREEGWAPDYNFRRLIPS